jgi:hypothetical protein
MNRDLIVEKIGSVDLEGRSAPHNPTPRAPQKFAYLSTKRQIGSGISPEWGNP